MRDNALQSDRPGPLKVAVVGGGISGLAAAAALAKGGVRVEVFESAKRLGGRAGSFEEPGLGAWVDRCRHVAMGCCRELLSFAGEMQVEDCFTRYRRLHFFSPTGQRSDFEAVRWLPAPLHLLPAFWRMPFLTSTEKRRIARLLGKLLWVKPRAHETAAEWLHREGQSENAVRRFWSVVLVSALSDSLDRVAATAARKVFRDGFLRRRGAYELFVPNVSLSEIFDARVAASLVARGVTIHRCAKVRTLEGDAAGVRRLVTQGGAREDFAAVIVAVPWYCVKSLLSESLWEAALLPQEQSRIEGITPGAIASVHLWFDRRLTPLPHAVLLERLGDWLFVDPPKARDPQTVHHEVVASAADDWLRADTVERTERIVQQLRWLFDPSGKTHLIRGRTVVEPRAVFVPTPELEANRSPQRTRVANLLLAGDWTATGWPSTMEGAVRAGRLAAKQVLARMKRFSPG